MLIIPAIDLLNGKAVRLKQGDMQDFTKYYDDPVDVAKMFADMGAERLHIVDLDGAKFGETNNYKTVERIVKATDMKVELGGGIRTMVKIGAYYNLGVSYFILGTVVVKNPDFVKEALRARPGQIILGVDTKDGLVATDGWYETSTMTAEEVISMYADFSAESVVFTDIARDGMLTGVNLERTLKLADTSPFPVIASGGVKGMEDIDALKKSAHPNLKGAIVGKAFYEGKIDLKAAINS